MKKQDVSALMSDVYRYMGSVGFASLVRCFIFSHGFRVTMFMRKAQSSRTFRWLYKRIFAHFRTRYGIQTAWYLDVGKGFYIGHFGSIIINGETVLGDNCTVNQGVTIGMESRGKRKGTPRIGNRVWIGANSVVVGKIEIGNNVLIAPLSFVNFDVPDNCIVVGNPAKIIPNMKATEHYINNCLE